MPKTGNELVTVGRLLAYLKTLPANMPIVMASDEEGNSYSPLTDFGIGGPILMEKDLRETAFDQEGKGTKALVIYPS
jgi:hypothetical protein